MNSLETLQQLHPQVTVRVWSLPPGPIEENEWSHRPMPSSVRCLVCSCHWQIGVICRSALWDTPKHGAPRRKWSIYSPLWVSAGELACHLDVCRSAILLVFNGPWARLLAAAVEPEIQVRSTRWWVNVQRRLPREHRFCLERKSKNQVPTSQIVWTICSSFTTSSMHKLLFLTSRLRTDGDRKPYTMWCRGQYAIAGGSDPLEVKRDLNVGFTTCHFGVGHFRSRNYYSMALQQV